MSTFEDYTNVEGQVVEPVAVGSGAKAAKVLGLICIQDVKTGGIDITLTNGANCRVPKNGKSRPILRKLVPGYVNRLAADGELKIINC